MRPKFCLTHPFTEKQEYWVSEMMKMLREGDEDCIKTVLRSLWQRIYDLQSLLAEARSECYQKDLRIYDLQIENDVMYQRPTIDPKVKEVADVIFEALRHAIKEQK